MRVFITLLFVLFVTQLSAQHTITVKHTYYTLQFDTLLMQPVLSTEWLTKAHLASVVKRGGGFHLDPLIPTRLQANANVYRKSGWDVGHTSPSADFRFDQTGQDECMYYSNCSLQQPQFNRSLWEHLEVYVRSVAATYDSVLVSTGCIYGTETFKGYGLPTHYFKVIKYNGIIEAFLGENVLPTSTDYKIMTVDVSVVEELSGLKFK